MSLLGHSAGPSPPAHSPSASQLDRSTKSAAASGSSERRPRGPLPRPVHQRAYYGPPASRLGAPCLITSGRAPPCPLHRTLPASPAERPPSGRWLHTMASTSWRHGPRASVQPLRQRPHRPLSADRRGNGPPALLLLHHRRLGGRLPRQRHAELRPHPLPPHDAGVFLYAFDLIELDGDDLRPSARHPQEVRPCSSAPRPACASTRTTRRRTSPRPMPLLFGRVTYEMMEAAFRPPTQTEAGPDWMEPFARTIDAAKKYVVSR